MALAHELGMSLGQVEQMTPDEMHLHLRFMEWRADEEKKAIEKAKKDQKRGPMKELVSFKR